jgi:hypothetical protein
MSNQRQLAELQLLVPAAVSTDGNGTAVDLAGYINPGGREMKACAYFGTKSGGLVIKMQENDTSTDADGDWADISGATLTIVSASTIVETHFKTKLQYVRAVKTVSGTGPSTVAGAWLQVEKRIQ